MQANELCTEELLGGRLNPLPAPAAGAGDAARLLAAHSTQGTDAAGVPSM